MKKGLAIGVLLIIAVAVSGMFFVSAAPRPGACPIQSDTNIVVYGDTGTGGVGSLSKSWIAHFFDWWKTYDANIKYVFLDRNDVKTDCNLANYPNVKLYVQPGGNAYYQQNALGSTGRTKILSYLDSGRAYLGICAGAFYAANDYYWQGSYYNWPNLLKRFPTVEGSITSIADYDANPGYALTSLDGGRFNMIYYGGPTRGWRNTPLTFPGEQKLTFTSIPRNLPASIKNGKMLLMSTHAEAFENDGISGLTTADRIENYKWLANSINDAAGTGFYVPAYTNPPQCSDGIDNDGDGFVDYPTDAGCTSMGDNDETDPLPMQCSDGIDNDWDGFIDYPADLGCLNALDNDETDVSGTVDLLFDNFEQGLSGWTLNTVSGGNPWQTTIANVYQGVYSAQSSPMSTSEPASVMERGVNTAGYSNVEFSYYRQLVGLDAADEFKAKWFDGGSWNIIEETLGNSADDAGYIYKVYSLPASAGNNANFKVRFECTAGAVSEFCRVDNVKVTGS